MDSQSFEEKFKEALANGVKSSKEMLTKAGAAVQKFSDKSVIKIERQQLIVKQKEKYTEMGKLLSDLLKMKGASIENLGELFETSANASEVKDQILACQTEIKKLDKEIAEHDKQLADSSDKKQIEKK